MKKIAINEQELAERWGPRHLKLSKRVTYLVEEI